jgi:thiol-disulfide isomerase/thioredoxin
MMRQRCSSVLVSVLAGSLLGGFGCASSDAAGPRSGGEHRSAKRSGQGEKKGGVGVPMPSVVVRELEGRRKIDLGTLHGKVVLVDIWASWCAPCMEEMPLLDEMAVRLRKNGVEIIAVSVDEDQQSAQTFLSSRAKWSLTVAHDPKGKLPEVLQPSKMPTSYVVDAEGIIRYVNEGFERGDLKTIEAKLIALSREAS